MNESMIDNKMNFGRKLSNVLSAICMGVMAVCSAYIIWVVFWLFLKVYGVIA